MQGFPVTFHTPCNLVRFPANEPLQCVSSVANIVLGSCKWSSCEASTALASLLQLAVASASTWVELQGGGPAQSTKQTAKLERSEWTAGFRETFWGGESFQTHLSNLVGHNWNILFQRQKYSTRPTHMDWKNFWKQKRSLLWSTWKRRHTKSLSWSDYLDWLSQ